MSNDLFDTRQEFTMSSGGTGTFHSLPALEKAGVGPISRLPVSIRIVLESVLRNRDGKKITGDHIRQLANWQPNAPRTEEIPFVVARILLQDFTGVPLLCDLAAMRSVASRLGHDPEADRAAGAGRSRRRSLGADGLLQRSDRARPQHEGGIPAQCGALQVHQVGNAGIQHLQGRSARGSASCTRSTSSILRAACTRRMVSTIPTRWSEPTRTRR